MHPNTIIRNIIRHYGFGAVRRKCGHFIDRYVRRPATLYALIVWGTTIWAIHIYPLFIQSYSPWFIAIGALLITLASISFLLVRYTSPGFVPANRFVHEDYAAAPQYSHANNRTMLKWFESLFLVERTSNGDFRVCHQCANRHYRQLGQLPGGGGHNPPNNNNNNNKPVSVVITVAKPDRAHHCSQLNRCVLKLDHYCPVTGNAIGLHTHKNFVLFLIYITLYTYFITLSTIVAKSNVIFHKRTAYDDVDGVLALWLRSSNNNSWLPDLWSTAQRRAHFVANLSNTTMGVASQAPEWVEIVWHITSNLQWLSMLGVACSATALLSWFTWYENVWAGCINNTTAIERAIVETERRAAAAAAHLNDNDSDSDSSDEDNDSDDDDDDKDGEGKTKTSQHRPPTALLPATTTTKHAVKRTTATTTTPPRYITPVNADTRLPSRYDQGVWRNLKQVFGEKVWTWPLPQFSPPATIDE